MRARKEGEVVNAEVQEEPSESVVWAGAEEVEAGQDGEVAAS